MYFSTLIEKFDPVLVEFSNSAPIKSLMEGRMTIAEYRSILRQIFHHTRENPQLQAAATVGFRGRQRDVVRAFFKHANSEIGHDQLALNDFVVLGGDPAPVPYENPLPATSALLAFGFHQIQNHNPIGYLGYLFFLEFMPTRTGGSMMDRLKEMGVPDHAMSFIKDHSEIDVAHNKYMEKYADQLIMTQADFDAVVYAMKTTGFLYAQMLGQAMEYADKEIDTGTNWSEVEVDQNLDNSQVVLGSVA